MYQALGEKSCLREVIESSHQSNDVSIIIIISIFQMGKLRPKESNLHKFFHERRQSGSIAHTPKNHTRLLLKTCYHR